nr:hypothetical protein [Tanacetum cinerariifolium]
GIKAVPISRRNSLSTIRMKMSNTISKNLLARCLKVNEIIDASIARIDSIRNDKAEEEISAKEAKDLVCVVCLLVHDLIMIHGFLDASGRNNNHKKKKTTDTGTCSSSGSDGILNDATYCVDAAMKVVSLVNTNNI